MATRSTIAIEYADGTVDQIYCHWDGYLSNNGRILTDHYLDPFVVQQLMELGGIASLQPTVQETAVEAFSQRGEVHPADRHADFAEYERDSNREEYNYILRRMNGTATWLVECGATDGEWMTIASATRLETANQD